MSSGVKTYNPNLSDSVGWYLAGIFDGEGCVSVSISRTACLRIDLSVQMCDPTPPQMFYDRFGGYISLSAGKTKTGRTVAVWRISGGRAIGAVSDLVSRCVVKRHLLQAALPMCESIARGHGRAAQLNLRREEKERRLAACQMIADANANKMPSGLKKSVFNEELVRRYLESQPYDSSVAVIVDGVGHFESQTEAARILGVTTSNVAAALRNGWRVKGHRVTRATQ